MKILKFTLLALSIWVISSCSSVQVTDSYQAPDSAASWNNDFLVVTRTNDRAVRSSFENAMVTELNNGGVKSASSLSVYPNLDVTKNYSNAEINQMISDMQSEGYNGIVLNVLKNVKNETSTVPVGGDGFYGAYPGYYYGFGGYYMNPAIYPSYNFPTQYETSTYQVFQLETTVYDLTKPANKQLVSVVSVDVTDPSSMVSNADDYAKKVVKELGK